MTDAQTIIGNLGGKWYNHYGVAPCPVCQPEARRDQTGLTLRNGDNGRLLAHCKKDGCEFTSILAASGVTRTDYQSPSHANLAKRRADKQRDLVKRSDQAKRCWQGTLPIKGTPAETYLRDRAIHCDLPQTLRFHPNCWHGPTAHRYPAMVALIDGADSFAVHRTYLRNDGAGKANIESNKLMLGSTRGGAVKLKEGHSRIVVAEGIETSLSLLCGLLGKPASVWAALSTSGMAGLRLPAQAAHLTIAPDADSAGIKAAYDLAERASRLGWQVDLLIPPQGQDWNDVLGMEFTK